MLSHVAEGRRAWRSQQVDISTPRAGARGLDTPAGDGTMSSPAGRRRQGKTELLQLYPKKQEVGSSHALVYIPRVG